MSDKNKSTDLKKIGISKSCGFSKLKKKREFNKMNKNNTEINVYMMTA